MGQASLRFVQAMLVAAAVAAIVILLGLFGTVASVISLAVIAAAALAAAPFGRGAGWWLMLSAGAVLSVGGALVALASDTLGGLIAVIGAALVVIAAALGFPLDEERA